ncbi:FMN-dependent NADH-azoreductase [Mycoplasmopsis bovigenitalium]|uniref:FMN-dependent NADH-azoreductase n=1 Tax=Mycoplasmopsis bovigenitalium TaxID=2112 RepID=A0A449A8K7_9BACT|nr:FMN-dependent NADH-azoreductase [Mycoplasmopsis bovigenitalium]VEU60623.1 FMN-dependent NADH-azoreductase [Mycoplasmopsis bovigenitalium]
MSIQIFSVIGSVNKDSLSEKLNNEVVKLLMKKFPNSTLNQLNTSNSEFQHTSLNANNFSEFFTETNSDHWIDILKETNVLVISSPMVNFNYSAGIKNFIDSVAVANKTFSYKYSKKNGSIGLLDNLKVIILGTQGAPEGWYPFGNFIENLRGIFDFFGANQIETLLVAGNKVEPNSSKTHEQIIDENQSKLIEIVNSINY